MKGAEAREAWGKSSQLTPLCLWFHHFAIWSYWWLWCIPRDGTTHVTPKPKDIPVTDIWGLLLRRQTSHLKWAWRWWFAGQLCWPQNRRRCCFLHVGLNYKHLRRAEILSLNANAYQCIVLAEAHLLLFPSCRQERKKQTNKQKKTQISDSEASSFVCPLVPLQVPQRLLLPFLEKSGRVKLHSFNPFSNKNKCHCLPLLEVYLVHSYLQTQTQLPTNKESTAPSLTQALCGLWLARKEIHSCLLKLVLRGFQTCGDTLRQALDASPMAV